MSSGGTRTVNPNKREDADFVPQTARPLESALFLLFELEQAHRRKKDAATPLNI